MQIIINIYMNKFMYITYMNMELHLHADSLFSYFHFPSAKHTLYSASYQHASTDYYLDKYLSLTYPYYTKV